MSGDVVSEARGEPKRSRPRFHAGYGVATDEAGMLTWSWAAQRLANALLYWAATVNPNGRPHARPIWGVFVEGELCLENGPSRTRRNLDLNPAIAVHVENGDDVVIVEGDAEPAFALPREAAERIAGAFGAKYGDKGYHPDPEQYQQTDSGLYRIQPRVAFAWSNFAQDPTRWVF
ncbi:MAG: pyridoxamine 5'-phosphate oxidase family protein [Chloroflexota bacterium]